MLIKSSEAKAGALAFIPESLHNVGRDPSSLILGRGWQAPHSGYGDTSIEIAVYWVEVKKGKRIMAIGGYCFTFDLQKAFPDAKHAEEITYEQLISHPAIGTGDIFTLSQMAYRKVGYAKPWEYNVGVIPTMPLCDEEILDRMLEDSSYLPANADGWYKISKRKG